MARGPVPLMALLGATLIYKALQGCGRLKILAEETER